MTDVTRILSQMSAGDPHAANELLPLVYEELRKLAAAKLAHEKPGQTLQATALVHEAYLRLVGSQEPGASGQKPESAHLAPGSRPLVPAFNSRAHFFAAAAEAMRRILVDQARRKKSSKRGGHLQRQDLDAREIAAPQRGVDLLALDEALVRLETLDRRKAELVKWRYFAGMTLREAAEALNIAESTADADWAY